MYIALIHMCICKHIYTHKLPIQACKKKTKKLYNILKKNQLHTTHQLPAHWENSRHFQNAGLSIKKKSGKIVQPTNARLFPSITDVLLSLQTETEHINLKVLGQDNAVVQFKIKKHTPLRKLMNAYCDRAVNLDHNGLIA